MQKAGKIVDSASNQANLLVTAIKS